MNIQITDPLGNKMILTMDVDTTDDVCAALKLIHLFIMGWELENNGTIGRLFSESYE